MFYPRLTVAEIDLKAFRFNLKKIRSLLKPKVKLMVVVKANAYGHGLKRIAQESQKLGVDWLGTACIEEVIRCRQAGVKLPILNLNPLMPQEAEAVFKFDYRPTVFEINSLKRLSKLAVKVGRKVKVHLKVDTGLGRIGLQPEEVVPFVRKIQKLKGIVIEGIYTQFAIADGVDREPTLYQLGRFNKVLSDLKKEKLTIPLVHAANSGATLWYPQAHFNMVRVAKLPFGISPNSQLVSPIKLKPSLTLKTFVTFVKKVPMGTPISYGWNFYTKRPSIIATIAVGYADGFRRAPKTWGYVLVKGKPAGIVGRIGMDQSMVDVTNIKGVKIGDEVILIGKQGRQAITIEEVAERLETNHLEVLTSTANRITRIYKG